MRQQVRDTFVGPGTAYQRIREYLPRERDVLRGCGVGRLAVDIHGGYALARAERSAEPFDRAIQGALELLRMAAAPE